MLYSSIIQDVKYEIEQIEVYPGSSYTSVKASFAAINISKLSSTVVIRYGASDNGTIIYTDDGWSIKNVTVSISFTK